MPSSAKTEVLGRGVYNLAEVARYTQIPQSTVRSWFKERSDGKGKGPVFHGDYSPVSNDYAVSFLDLIDANIAGQLRNAGVRMRMIRAAYDALKFQLESPHPFAHADIYTDGKRIFTYVLDDEGLVEVLTRQHFFATIRDLLSHIRYDETTKIAKEWEIAQGVVIDPSVSFGKPVVKGTGVTTFVVSRSFVANKENSALVADLFRVTETDVLNAVRFEEEHGWQMAA